MKSSNRAAILLLCLTLPGCVTARATLLGGTRYAPVPEEEVRVFLEADEVPEECERVALIHASGDADVTNEQQMITAARRRAGKVGANAVLVNDLRDPSTGTRVAAVVFGVSAERKGEMLAYRCPAPAGRVADSGTPAS